MPNVIRIKRRASSSGAGAPSSLANAELAYNEATDIGYYGTGTGGAGGSATSVVAVFGPGAFLGLSSGLTQTAAGTYTFSGGVTFSSTVALGSSATATTPAADDNSTAVATTAWVQNEIAGFAGGTVTSVALTVPNFLSVTGSPITTSGTLAVSLATQTANTIFAGPTTGSAAAPTFRSLTADDIPSLSGVYIPMSGSATPTGTYTFSGTVNVTGTFQLGSTSVTSSAAELNLVDGSVANTVVNSKAVIYGSAGQIAATTIATTGNATVGGNLTVSGNLTVDGTVTTVNSTTITVDDKNIELGSVYSPTDTTADGGGITLKGATDKTWNWVNATDSWTSSEHIDLASGKSYKIAGTDVLSATALGSAVVSSSLTSVGTIATGTWSATEIAVTKGGTGLTSVAKGTVLVANTANTITALDGGGSVDGLLTYTASSDTIAWANEIDGGTF
jgi:hypothetical protein